MPSGAAPALGPVLSSHLSHLLVRLLQQRPDDPLKAFETISADIKAEKKKKQADGADVAAAAVAAAAPPASTLKSAPWPLIESQPALDATLAFLAATKEKFKKTKKLNEDGEEEEEEEEEPNPNAPDIVEQAALLKQAGVSLSEDEIFRLSLSTHSLMSTVEGLESVRFWGKVFGTERDYYVLEAKLADYPDAEEEEAKEEAERALQAQMTKPPPDVGEDGEPVEEEQELPTSNIEPYGSGCNEHVYYVSNSADGPFRRLPKVLPEQIVIARGIRRFLTGCLDAPVLGFPRFQWRESSLLRAQIARITSSTALAPKGMYLADEDDPSIVLENEEFRGVRASTLLNGENWVHYRAKILREGRVEPYVNENAPEEEDEVDEEDLDPVEREKRAMEKKKKEKVVPVLSPAAADRMVLGQRDADARAGKVTRRAVWKFALSYHADLGTKPKPPPKNEEEEEEEEADSSESQVVASAHSLLWPGAISIVQNKQHAHVYVGYGLKVLDASGKKPYRPTGPPQPMREWKAAPDAQPDLLVEQVDALPPPPEQRSAEELEEEEEEEKARLKRLEEEEENDRLAEEDLPPKEEEEEQEKEEEEED